MDFTRQTEAYGYIQTLLNNGHTMKTLPISRETVEGIIRCHEPVTDNALRLLKQEVDKQEATATPTIDLKPPKD